MFCFIESVIEKKNHELKSKVDTIAHKEKAIAEKEKTIKEKSDSITSLQSEVASLEVRSILFCGFQFDYITEVDR